MASPYRRRFLNAGVARGNARMRDSGTQDLTNPDYLLVPTLGPRFVRTMTGRGTYAPGYVIPGEQAGGLAEGLVPVRVVKMVSPLTGQGPADPRATGYFFGMDFSILAPRIYRQAKSVPTNTGLKVVRPPRSAIRRMDNRGQGTVGYV
jgi:hypothetical protein